MLCVLRDPDRVEVSDLVWERRPFAELPFELRRLAELLLDCEPLLLRLDVLAERVLRVLAWAIARPP